MLGIMMAGGSLLTKHPLILGPPIVAPNRGGRAPESANAGLSCRSCGQISSPREIREFERLDGFCSERHKFEWLVIIFIPLFGDRQLIIILHNHSREKNRGRR